MPASAPPSVAYSAGVVEPVLVHLVEAEGDVERRGLGVPVLAGEVVEQALGRDGQLAHAALEEVAGERRFRRDAAAPAARPIAAASRNTSPSRQRFSS